MIYDENYIRGIIKKLFSMDIKEIRSIGHYELNRHYVFILDSITVKRLFLRYLV
ncbi:hypothetical protein [Caloramator sp. Dgby_cultured_2]|uniref:hypothetical protein n=1 Tax=Caloramator sp. Dgby_cultured_2 TaxID=3029174 RepID=UPI00237E305A|nr:hypothetical protein [Caloramator sp. Dgby_cultured_2]WDU83273.1 hypothetical protein PWK10_00535 [Caloramator sp. Dgby_cultured_2]